MAAVSYSSNRNGGALMGVGGSDMICSNLISRLLLVSNTLFFLSVLGERAWFQCVSLHLFGPCGPWCYCVLLHYFEPCVTLCYYVFLHFSGPFGTGCQWVFFLDVVSPGGSWCSLVLLLLMVSPVRPWC